jgi:TRAP-type mannitol/chloroaromatic compound transport system permease small subunit
VRKFYNSITSVSGWTAKISSWIVLLLILTICYDVFMRYLFNAPTTWSYILSFMIGAAFSALGQAWGLSIGSNVRVDIFYARFSPKTKLIIDIVFAIIFFFPLYGFLVYYFGEKAWDAFVSKQYAIESIWYPVLWPYITVVTFGLGLLFVQGIAIFLRDVMRLAKGGKEPW